MPLRILIPTLVLFFSSSILADSLASRSLLFLEKKDGHFKVSF